MRLGLAVDVLHNVNLTTSRPPNTPDVAAQCPERGPQALAGRDRQAGFDLAVLELALALGLDAAGGVSAGAVPALIAGRVFLAALDGQGAAIEDQVVPIGVVLPFVIASAGTVHLARPIAGVE